jgi:hypothetical protein
MLRSGSLLERVVAKGPLKNAWSHDAKAVMASIE